MNVAAINVLTLDCRLLEALFVLFSLLEALFVRFGCIMVLRICNPYVLINWIKGKPEGSSCSD